MRISCGAFLSLLIAALAGSAAARANIPCVGEPSTSAYAMTYDPVRAITLIFGGVDTRGQVNADVWGWDGARWTCVTGAGPSGPGARTAAMLAYDPARRVVVLYGGRGRTSGLRDTWELAAQGWSRKDAAGPTDQPHGAFAYDAASGGVLLYQAVSEEGPGRKTWLWDGEAWAERADGPDGQWPNAMLSSDGHHPALLTTAMRSGGPSGSNPGLYEWQADAWTSVETAGDVPVFSPQAPTARTVDGVLLFAGFEPSGAVATWVFGDGVWRRHHGPEPSRRKGAQMVWDPVRSVVVLHGGDDGSQVLTDTWEWNGEGWRQVVP